MFVSNSYDAWIGREVQGEDILTPRVIKAWSASLDFSDLEMPRVPLGTHWGLAIDFSKNADLAHDGHPHKGGFLPPVELPRRMWAGGELQLHDQLIEGDRVFRQSRIAGVERKEGRTGELCFVSVQHEWSTQRGVLLSERQDIVYRGAQSSTKVSSQIAPEPQRLEERLEIHLTEAVLFRFSALTFNSHRIHYDYPYATTQEGYSGLVVHGPLQASLLLNYARQVHGSQPRTFNFRGVSPLVLGGPVTLNAAWNDRNLELWVADTSGRETMRATASWSGQ